MVTVGIPLPGIGAAAGDGGPGLGYRNYQRADDNVAVLPAPPEQNR
jgi:hypothetical protein